MSKTLCPMPFVGFDIETNGTVKPCCIYEGSIGNVNDQTIEEIWTGDAMHEVRAGLLSGRAIKGCRQCWVEEASTNTSKRLREIPHFDDKVYKSPAPRRLDIKLGNTCNLKCRICNFESSSLFNSENRQIQNALPQANVDVISNADVSRYKWYKDDAFWTAILTYADTIEQIDFMGGEPLLDKTHQRVLELFVERGLAKKITLNYTTNGTLVPNFDLLREFKQVLFTVSGDAIEQRFEYNRFPVKWTDFKQNIEDIRMGADSFLISYSVSSYSLFGIPDALDYYSRNNFIVWFNYVHLTEASNARNLPSEVKQQFRDLVAARQKEDWSWTRANIQEVLDFIDTPDNPEHFRGFIYDCKLRDRFRDQDFQTYLPEFSPYVNIASLSEKQ